MSIFSNKSGRGVMVTSVVTNGVADETGKIKEGDEIVKVCLTYCICSSGCSQGRTTFLS